MSDYSKHKDRKPEETIFQIQSILNRAGLFTTVQWSDSQFDGVRSNRVSIWPTNLGSNGKGTDELYTMASGYAELIERIQNYALGPRCRQPELISYAGFERQPDERLMTVDEILEQHDPFLTHFFRKTGLFAEKLKKEYLLTASRLYYEREDGSMPVIPFADVKGQRIVWIPSQIAQTIYGSNGMAAGNTMEEALVQGISELFERYVHVKILREECVPPQIPDEALQAYNIWNLIQEIQKSGRYNVRVLDCSLGKGLPVCGTMIIDREQGKFSMKLGSHPSFAVSVERTLTETFQGREIQAATSINRVGTREESVERNNIPNVMKIGIGVYPRSMLTETPQWTYRPWTEWEGLDNRGFLRKMLVMLDEMGFSPLVRDASHLGFPACYVIIPGFSEMYPTDPLAIRTSNSASKNAVAFSHFPNLTDQEEERLLNLICFKENATLENIFGNLVMRPIGGKLFQSDRVGAYLALKHGDYPLAIRFFEKVLRIEEDETEKRYLRCMTEYIRCLKSGLNRKQAEKVVLQLYDETAAGRVLRETEKPEDMMGKVFPQLTCFDCEKCPEAGKDCLNSEEVKIFKRIKDAMKDSKVSQEDLLKKLIVLTGE